MNGDKSEKQLNLVQKILNHNETLSPLFFDGSAVLWPEVEQKLLVIADIFRQKLLANLNGVDILDIVACGNLCGYIYNADSDWDLAIVTNDFAGKPEVTNHILGYFNSTLADRGFRFSIAGHAVDYFALQSSDFIGCGYSLLKHEWIKKPVKRSFSFTPQFCFEQYCLLSSEVHHVVHSLPKYHNSFLTEESCDELEKYLEYLRRTGLEAKRDHPEHEYSLAYNLFRCLKYFGTYNHFRSYIRDSRNFHANRGAENE